MTRRVVYTALFGEHEALVEQPVANGSQIPFLCFSDNPSLESQSWKVIHTSPLFAADPRRSQRDIKIRGHAELAQFDEWLYIDNTVLLHSSPEQILDEWLNEADWAAFGHDVHGSTWEEFESNLAANKDTQERIHEQLQDYSAHHAAALDHPPLWNGFFARSNNEAVREFAALWFDHVCRYSARDQLSVMVALEGSPVKVNVIRGSARKSQWHSWPHRTGETKTGKAARHAKTTGLKPLAEELLTVREALAASEKEIQRLQDAKWWGLGGLLRRLRENRRHRRRVKRDDLRGR